LPAGRVEESLFESKQALLLEPLSLGINLHLGWHYLYSRQTDQAVEQLLKTLEIDPAFALGLCFIGQAYEQKGMYREAVAAFEKAVSLSNDNPTLLAALGHGYALARRRTKAEQVLQRLKEWSTRSYVPSYEIAVVYAGLNEKEQSLAWLDRACDLRDSSWLVDLKVDPRFYRLHTEPKFRDLVRRIGIP
jgi:tetratricopeptide (TPR) repeat protein